MYIDDIVPEHNDVIKIYLEVKCSFKLLHVYIHRHIQSCKSIKVLNEFNKKKPKKQQ